MDEIICYTGYVPYGEEREITFMELLLDDNLANGELECPEKVYADIGNRNHKLTAKQDYEFLLRAVRKYKIRTVGIEGGEYIPRSSCDTWDEYRTDCYVMGKYQSEIIASGYYPDVMKALMEKALELPEPGKGIAWLKKMIAKTQEYYEIDDDTRPILIYRNNNFCHHVLASFAEELARALHMCRQRVALVDISEDENALQQLAGKRFKAVIGIQTRVLLTTFLSTTQEGYFFDLVSGPKYNIILDHPIDVRYLLENHPENYYVMVHDRNYEAFIKRYWPGIKDCICFPPGGIGTDTISSGGNMI